MPIDDAIRPNPKMLGRRQCRHGEMIYFRHDRYIGRSLDMYGEYSEGEIALFDALIEPGMTVIDVGANIGCHTLFFAKKAGAEGRVIAIEAQGILHRLLTINLKLNDVAFVEAIHCACGAGQSERQFPIIDYARPANFGGMSLSKQDHGERVPVVPLDKLQLTKCDFIKIDVEGMEIDVVAGAVRLIEECRPILYVENDRAEKQRALIERLTAHGYSLYWHSPALFNDKNYFRNETNVFGATRSLNMLCIPENSSIDVAALATLAR